MKVGFTGTQHGMSLWQQEQLRNLLLEPTFTEFYHGDCIGADNQAHTIALSSGLQIVVHPPTDDRKRAFVAEGELLPQYPYLERNKHIVEACDLLIAAPKTLEEIVRSGTWSTVRYARRIGRKYIILEP